MGSKLFHSLKYTFHSIYSNSSPYTKHNLLNNLFKHTLGWVYVNIYILLPHSHFPLSKKIMSQHNSNYSSTHIISMGSKLFHSLKYTFHSIYYNTSPYTEDHLSTESMRTLYTIVKSLLTIIQLFTSVNCHFTVK